MDVNIMNSYCRNVIEWVKILSSKFITSDGQNRLSPQSVRATSATRKGYLSLSTHGAPPSLPGLIDSLTSPKRERERGKQSTELTKTSSDFEPSKRSTQIATAAASPKNCIQSRMQERRVAAARGSDRRRKGACRMKGGKEGPPRPRSPPPHLSPSRRA